MVCRCSSDPLLLWLWHGLDSYSSDLTPSLRTSICHGSSPKKGKKTKKKKKKKKDVKENECGKMNARKLQLEFLEMNHSISAGKNTLDGSNSTSETEGSKKKKKKKKKNWHRKETQETDNINQSKLCVT